MGKADEKLRFIQEYLEHPEKYLPLFEHAWKEFPEYDALLGDLNIGWDVGLIGENRPYFCECWRGDGLTVRTYFIAREGIEAYSIKDLEELFGSERIAWYIGPHKYKTSVAITTDSCGNEFYSINYIVEDDDGPYVDGSKIFSFDVLNEFNKNRTGQKEQ